METFGELKNPAFKAAERLSQIFIEDFERPMLLLLSGGSSLAIESCVSCIDTQFITKRVALAMVDERFSSDQTVNNFAQLTNTFFYKQIMHKNITVFDSHVHEGDTIESLAERFEAFLRSWKKQHHTGHVIAILGIGEDGHTAGIMPYRDDQEAFEKLFYSDRWVAHYTADQSVQHPHRITTTGTFLQHEVDHTIVYAVGAGKQEILRTILQSKQDIHQYPARIIHTMQNVYLFTDQTL